MYGIFFCAVVNSILSVRESLVKVLLNFLVKKNNCDDFNTRNKALTAKVLTKRLKIS